MPDNVTITGGAGADTLADTGFSNRLFGLGGNDVLTATHDLTTLTGGLGNDTLVATGQRDVLGGDEGDDLISGPVSGSAQIGPSWTLFGGVGNDTVSGSGFVDGGDGDDVLSGQGLLMGDAGADRLTGSGLLQGGDGNDTLEGPFTGAPTTLQGGNGDDLLVWRHGESEINADGGAGADAMRVDVGNFFDVLRVRASPGGHAQVSVEDLFFPVDAVGVETFNLAAQATTAGDRHVVLEPLNGTDVRTVNLDLTRAAGVNATYSVGLLGSTGNDQIAVTVDGAGTHVTETIGGAVNTTNLTSMQAGDTINLDGSLGADTLSAVGGAGTARILLNGGLGDDVLAGSAANSTMIGGAGNDTLTGGAGGEHFVWNPGDGTDRVDGGGGSDTQDVSGGGGNDTIVLSAVSPHALASVNGAVAADTINVETINLHASDGADAVQVGDLSGTAVRNVLVDLLGANGVDASADTVSLAGSAGADQISINVAAGASAAGSTAVVGDTANGVTVTTTVAGLGAADRVTVNAGGGDDVITSTGADPTRLVLVDGGAGQDTHVLSTGAGNDVLTVSAANRVVTIDNLGVLSQDTNVETLTLRTLGGSDGIQVGDLSATSVKVVNIDLSGPSGTPDGIADGVDLTTFGAAGEQAAAQVGPDGTSETVTYSLNGVVTRTVNITGMDALDRVTLAPATVQGGAGDDVLNGSTGGDSLNAGGGSDTINAGGGSDTIQAGAGNDQVNEAVSSAAVSHVAVDGGAGQDGFSVATPATASTLTFGLGAVAGHYSLGVAAGAGGLNADLFSVENAAVDASHLTSASITGSAGPNFLVLLQSGANVFVEGSTIPVVTLNNLAAGAVLQVTTGDAADTLDATRMGAAGHGQVLNAGGGNDTLLVSQSTAFGGAGNDTFIWLRDAGADTLDGGSGNDTQTISTGGSTDTITFTANGSGHVIESLDGKAQDVVGVETISIAAGDRADTINLGDTSHTDLRTINVDLTGASGGPDGAVDVVNLAAPTGGVQLNVVHAAGSQTAQAVYTQGGTVVQTVNITGMDATDQINVTGTPGADTLSGSGQGTVVSGADGDDRIGVSGGAVGNGDAGNDTVNGSGGLTVVNGGAGADSLSGVGGSITLNGGDGNDRILADLQDGRSQGVHMTVDGGVGLDSLNLRLDPFSIDVARFITIGAGGQAHLVSDVPPDPLDGSVRTVDATVSFTGIESLSVAGGRNSDEIVVGDQSGTGLTSIAIDLGAGPDGGSDGIRDNITLFGTAGADHVFVENPGATSLDVDGLPETVTFIHIDPGTTSLSAPSDDLVIRTGGGDDVVDLTEFDDEGIVLSLDLGAGANTVLGGSATFSYQFLNGSGAHDDIFGFHGHSENGHDTLDLGSWADTGIHSVHDLFTHGLIQQIGVDTVITDGINTFVRLHNFSDASLLDSDIFFGT